MIVGQVAELQEQMRKLKKALYSARVRARWWREQGKWQTQIVKSARDVLTEVQDQRDFLLSKCAS